MKSAMFHKFAAAALVVLAVAVLAPAASFAAGTIAGTVVTNTVTINYNVGAVPAAAVITTVSFTVDTKVNVTVQTQDTNVIAVAPGATGAVLSFLVTNTSNTALDFALTSVTTATVPFVGGASNFATPPALTAYVDGDASHTYNAADTTNNIINLAPDTGVWVFLVGNIGTEANGAIEGYGLIATAKAANSAAAGLLTHNGAYNGTTSVFADAANGSVGGDGANQGNGSDRGGFQVTALTITKTAVTYSDPVNLTTSPRAIPGATITYIITINNSAGTSNATNVSISDNLGSLPVTFTGAVLPTAVAFNDSGSANPSPIDCTASGTAYGIVVNGQCFTNTADGAETHGTVTADANFAAGTITVSGLTVNAGTTAVIKYQVVLN